MDPEITKYANLLGALHCDAIRETNTVEAMSEHSAESCARRDDLARLSEMENTLRAIAVCRCPCCGVELGTYGRGVLRGQRAGICPTDTHPLHPTIACGWSGTFYLRDGVVRTTGDCVHDSGDPGDDCALCGPDSPRPLGVSFDP